jgi:hypothetical protein
MDYDRVDETTLHPLMRLELHVGRFILNGAELDQEVTKLVSVLANFGAPRRALAFVEGRNANEKLEMLDAVLPSNMTNRDLVVKALKDLNQYRNRLAHSAAEVDIEAVKAGSDIESVYRFVKERTKGSRSTAVDFTEMNLQSIRLRIMTILVYDFRLAFTAQHGLFGSPFSAMDVFLLRNQRLASAQDSWWRLVEDLLGDTTEAQLDTDETRPNPSR